jgi:hypothetical protein
MDYQSMFINVSKWTVHGDFFLVLKFSPPHKLSPVEVRLKRRASARFETIKSAAYSFVTSFDRLILPSTLEGWEGIPELAASVEQMVVCEAPCPKPSLTRDEMAIQVHVYQPSQDTFEEYSNSAGPRDQDDDTMAATVCELPNRLYEGLWDSLIYAGNIKMKLLDYIYATLLLSDANIDGTFSVIKLADFMTSSCSQSGLVESCCTIAWSSRDRKDVSLSRPCTKIGNPPLSPVHPPTSFSCSK